MIIEVDVKRVEQSWDLNTRRQQNYFVIEVFGVETRVPCSEEQLATAIAQSAGVEEAGELDIPEYVNEKRAVTAPATFVTAPEQPIGPPEDATSLETRVQPKQRRLAPMRRERGDDVGIPQG
jgi:hypothetical protein